MVAEEYRQHALTTGSPENLRNDDSKTPTVIRYVKDPAQAETFLELPQGTLAKGDQLVFKRDRSYQNPQNPKENFWTVDHKSPRNIPGAAETFVFFNQWAFTAPKGLFNPKNQELPGLCKDSRKPHKAHYPRLQRPLS